MSKLEPKAILATCGSWHMQQTAKAFEHRGALVEILVTDKNSTGIAEDKFRRCWPYHVAMKPFYHFASQIWREKAAYACFPIWKRWLQR
ncbi:MAG: hypothetical protein ABJF10_10695, partial [Chthoniobacter sp.]|uniref:hypothetical protein n=1 Tax=Chthoniobacter sp. TaxID=2510640 RepID=UPI0032AA3CE0